MNTHSPMVTVVVPVYNVEDYLSACLDSLLTQTYRDIEVICVNDGSTDKSRDILQAYELKDSRLRVIDQVNQGPSAARNSGIQAARGKYICFIDSDDLLEAEALEKLQARASADELDLLLYRWVSFSYDPEVAAHNANEAKKDFQDFSLNGVFSGKELFCELIENDVYNASPCLQFIRTEHLRSHAHGFKYGILHEDELFTPICIILAERAALINDTFFHRRVHPDSIMTRHYSPTNVKGYFEVLLSLLSFYKTLDTDERLEKACRVSLFDQYRMTVYTYNSLTEKEKELCGYATDSINGLLFDLLIVNKDQLATSDLLFAHENYLSTINSSSFKIGRIITAFPRLLRDLVKKQK